VNVFVAGHRGFLGKKVVFVLSKEHTVFPEQSVRIDFLKEKIPHKFDVLVNCAAQANVDECERNKKDAYEKNVVLVKKLLEQCNQKSFFVQISTDYVLDSVNYYSETKKEAEELVRNSGVPHCILRVSGLYGFNDAGDKNNFAKWLISQKGKEIALHDSVSVHVTFLDDVAKVINRVIRERLEGTFNCVGPVGLTKKRFGGMVYSAFGFDSSKIGKSGVPGFWVAKRPARLDIKSDFVLCGPKEGLKEMRRQMEAAGVFP
jgi:dTDP-4-dehydrorhamnose reductase